MSATAPIVDGGSGIAPTSASTAASAEDAASAPTTKPTQATIEDFQSRTISSPHELTDWVDNMLDTLQGRFDDMKSAVDQRMIEMSNRIDALESSIEELIQGHNSTDPTHH